MVPEGFDNFDTYNDNYIILKTLPAFKLFDKTIHELLGLYNITDIPLQIASFIHYGGTKLLSSIVHALMVDNVIQAFNETGSVTTLAIAVDSKTHHILVNPLFTSFPPCVLSTEFVSMVMSTIILSPTGETSNLLRLVTGYSRNLDILEYFKELSLHFLFGNGFWPLISSKLVASTCASMSVLISCDIPFLYHVISKLDYFFFLPRLFKITHEKDRHVLARLSNMHPKLCPNGTFLCEHDKSKSGFVVRVFFSGAVTDILMQEALDGTVILLDDKHVPDVTEQIWKPRVIFSTPEIILPSAQCKEVRRVTTYLRTSSLLAPHGIICDKGVDSELKARSYLGQHVSFLQTLSGGHQRMVLSLAVALHLENPLAIQIIVADVEIYLDCIEKYNHGQYVTIIKSFKDIKLFSSSRRIFLLSSSLITLEFAEIFHGNTLKTLIIDNITQIQYKLLLVDRILKYEQLVITEPKQTQVKKPLVNIEIFNQKQNKSSDHMNWKRQKIDVSTKFTAFKTTILPSLLSSQELYSFNVLIIVNVTNLILYEEECRRMELVTARFDYEQNINQKLLVRALKNNKLQVVFVPFADSWKKYKMENVIITITTDNFTAVKLARQRCIVLS